MAKIIDLIKKSSLEFQKLQTKHKAYAISLCILGVIGIILFFRFNSALMSELVKISKKFSEFKYGKLVMFLLVFTVSFPPLIGYTAMCVFTGMAYGFPNGWPILAIATTLGSSCSFLLFRNILKSKAEKMAASNKHFSRLTRVLERDSFFILWLIRLYPLPYSLSNGAMSVVKTIKFSEFTLATALSTCKLLIPLFIGSRIVAAESGQGTKLANILSMSVAATAGVGASYLVYNRMQKEEEKEAAQELNNDVDPIEPTITDEFEV